MEGPFQPANIGSFMAPAGGGGSAIADAMARRGMTSGSVLNQVGTANPNAAETPAVPVVGAGSPSGVPQVPPVQLPAPQDQQPQGQNTAVPVGNPEAQIIIRALNQRLGSISKIDEANAGINKPASPPTTPINNGGLM